MDVLDNCGAVQDETRKLKLRSEDGEVIEVEEKAALMSALLEGLIVCFTSDPELTITNGNLPEEIITVPVVMSGDSLRRVFEFCTHHASSESHHKSNVFDSNGKADEDSSETTWSSPESPTTILTGPQSEDDSSESTWPIDTWDETFIKTHWPQLLGIYKAADYLGVQALLDLICRYICNHIAPMTPDEVGEFLGYYNDYSPEEAREILEKQPWVHENYPHEPTQLFLATYNPAAIPCTRSCKEPVG